MGKHDNNNPYIQTGDELIPTGRHAAHIEQGEAARRAWENGQHQSQLNYNEWRREQYEQGGHQQHLREGEAAREAYEKGPHAALLKQHEAEHAARKKALEDKRRAEALKGSGGPQINVDYYDDAERKVLASHPELNPAAVHEVATAYKEESFRRKQMIERLQSQRTQDGLPPSPGAIRAELQRIDNENIDRIYNRMKAQYGDEGVMAMRAFNRQVTPPNLIDKAVNQIYNPDKGGFQWDGAIGAAIGGWMAWSMLGGIGGAGKWLQLAGILLGGLVGAWAANAATDTFGKYFTWGKKNEPAQGPAQQPQKQRSAGKGHEPQNPIKADLVERAQAELSAPQKAPAAGEKTYEEVENGTPVAPAPLPANAAKNGQKPAQSGPSPN